MDEADDRDLLLARRLKLGVRLVVYPLLLALIVVVWHAKHADGAEEPAPQVAWRGMSAQSEAVSASTSGGSLTYLQVAVLTGCDDGTDFTYRLVQPRTEGEDDGSGIDVRRAAFGLPADDGSTYSYRLHLTTRLKGAVARGTIDVAIEWARPLGLVHCRSGVVPFTLRRS